MTGISHAGDLPRVVSFHPIPNGGNLSDREISECFGELRRAFPPPPAPPED
jgi:hypothetical protein